MTTKTISIQEEVYELLKKFKRADESFGDTILRLCGLESAKGKIGLEFEKAVDEIFKEDRELLERLAQ